MREVVQSVLVEPVTEQDGIFTTAALAPSDPVFVGKQFLDDAETYHAKYFNVGQYVDLLAAGLEGIHLGSRVRILDLGSGSGNSVLAALRLFPDAEIVATDISPNLLRILRRVVPADSRLACVCCDGQSLNLYPGSVNLIIGAAILHHLLNPGDAVKKLANAIGSGGAMIFYEPFEMANDILALAYKRIVDSHRELDPKSCNFLSALVRDIEARRGMNEKEYTRFLDDKWLFTSDFFRHLASHLGFALSIKSLHDRERPFTSEALVHARLGDIVLPDWALDLLAEYDTAFSQELREELMFTGVVTLRKP